MPNWLADDPTTVYVILGALALVVLGAGWVYRDRAVPIGTRKDPRKEPRTLNAFVLAVIAAGVLVLLAGVVRLIDGWVVSDEEQIVLVIQDMAEGVKTRDTERVFRHVSDTFRSPRNNDRTQSRELARGTIEHSQITDIAVWDFRFGEEVSRSRRSATVSFAVQVKGSIRGAGEGFYGGCEARFYLDPDDRWRLQGFKLTTPPPTTQELPVPF